MKTDLQGRQFIAHHDVRDALVSASASLSTGTAGTFLAPQADYFLDLIEVTLSNNSTVTARVELKTDGTTMRTVSIAAGSSVQLFFDAPLRQQTKNTAWMADMEDITGTTVVVEGTFMRKSD